MILQSLAEMARREGLLDSPEYENASVAWIVELKSDGKFLNVRSTRSVIESGGKKKKPQAKIIAIPRRSGRTSDRAAEFLVDKSEYVFGVEPDGKRRKEELTARRLLFLERVERAAKATEAPGLRALTIFLSDAAARDSCIAKVNAEGYLSNDLFAFSIVEGGFVHDLPEAREYWSKQGGLSSQPTKATRQCLVCGQEKIATGKHPTLKLAGGSTSGVPLVSFNTSSFEKYGLVGNENAPICNDCAIAYTTALRRCLDNRYPDPKGKGRLPTQSTILTPDTTAVFWCDVERDTLQGLGQLLNNNPAKLKSALASPHLRNAPATINAAFHCLILSGGQGRATLRGIHTGTVGQVEAALREYFRQLDVGDEHPRPLWALLSGLAPFGKKDKLSRHIVTDLFLAALFGGPLPYAILSAAVQRNCAEQAVTSDRAALLQAFLTRYYQHQTDTLEVPLSLNESHEITAYRLGMLLAILEKLQLEAQGKTNKTIVDRYYSAASTRPSVVFPSLLSLAQNHVAKLSEGKAAYRTGFVYQGLIGGGVGRRGGVSIASQSARPRPVCPWILSPANEILHSESQRRIRAQQFS